MGEALKRGRFSGLLYREVYLAKNDLRAGAVLFAVFAVFCLLVLLSFEYGNLGKLLDHVIGEPQTEEAKVLAEEKTAQIKQSIVFMMKILPVVMGSQFIIAGVNVTARDELVSWQRFARCSPVSPAKRAFVKVLMNAIYIAVSAVLSTAYMNIVGTVQGEPVTYSEYALAVMILSFIVMFMTLGQIYTIIFHSIDKGMLALMATIIVPIWTSAVINGLGHHEEPDEEEILNSIISFGEVIFPFTPLIIIGTLVLGFSAMYALYKRREK